MELKRRKNADVKLKYSHWKQRLKVTRFS